MCERMSDVAPRKNFISVRNIFHTFLCAKSSVCFQLSWEMSGLRTQATVCVLLPCGRSMWENAPPPSAKTREKEHGLTLLPRLSGRLQQLTPLIRTRARFPLSREPPCHRFPPHRPREPFLFHHLFQLPPANEGTVGYATDA